MARDAATLEAVSAPPAGGAASLPPHASVARSGAALTESGAAPPREDPEVGDAEDEEEEDSGYSIHHLSAVIRPVALTMILASIAVAKIRDPDVEAALSTGLSSYLVYNEGASASGGSAFGEAVINAIVIVSVIAAATFILVLCYYFRCLKLMIGYLIFASINLLGYTGGFMAYSAIQLWHIIVDWPTLVFIMYNFAIGGVISVFWQKGIPRIVTQAYLVAVSVIMAWMLTKLPEWTSWTLLVALALYDLCAVLTPCGPLRALINLAQKRRDPIPGLLYEADVGGGESGTGGAGDDDRVRDSFVTGAPARGGESRRGSGPTPGPAAAASGAASRRRDTPAETGGSSVVNSSGSSAALASAAGMAPAAAAKVSSGSAPDGVGVVLNPAAKALQAGAGGSPRRAARGGEGVSLLAAGGGASTATSGEAAAAHGGEDGDAELEAAAAPEAGEHEGEEEEEADDAPRSIKLGLGDFVFYSVLVSRAALFDAATMAACFVSVIMGLGGTLFLLGVFHKALPALPISIFLGVAFYFLTRLVVTPMIVELNLLPPR